LNKQTNSLRLKEHLNSFLKLDTFQNNIINVYLNLCVHQCLVSFVEKQHLCTPLICLADCSIPILLFFFFFALYLLCYSLFYLIISFSIAMSFFFYLFLFSRLFCSLSSSFAHNCLYLFSFYLYIIWFWLLYWPLFIISSSVSLSLSYCCGKG
jgi:CBS domain containing-hemolysin-like protein